MLKYTTCSYYDFPFAKQPEQQLTLSKKSIIHFVLLTTHDN
jgi:hypothetical protein